MSEQKSRTVNSTVWMAKNRAYSETCYFGNYATAVAWARGGTVVPVEIQHYTSPALRVPRTDMLAEAVRMIQGYKRAGWLTNPAAGEQAIDFIARASHEPGETCAWAYVDDGSWLTNCGETAILDNGGTAYSDMRFCCFCGKPTP
jgi:hypothetical protein